MNRRISTGLLATIACCSFSAARADQQHEGHHHAGAKSVSFSIRSVASGQWSQPGTWLPPRVPAAGDRVLISAATLVEYDVQSEDVIRMIQVQGSLSFARNRDTELNVALIKVQNSDRCTENGFACDFRGARKTGEPTDAPTGGETALLVGTPEQPIPAEYTALIRLHFLDGMNKDDAPAIACCSARMEFHGSPLRRTWLKLAADVAEGAEEVVVTDVPAGWRVGDEVIVTASEKRDRSETYRGHPDDVGTEERRITKIDGKRLTLDRPLELEHLGSSEFRSEVANLTRNVIVESADPAGVRGHTVYHRFSQGGISYARFAHLGKEGVLGRYAVHFHLVGDTMRGSQVLGAAIVDSHNRWLTIHGTEYLIVRDCIGYQSVGHGFFMEDATEVYNLLQGNLGVQAYHGKRLPGQVLPFDPNEGAAFWWANGRNTLVDNVSCENDEYGFRYDMQHSKYFNSTLPVRMADGVARDVDVRTIPIWRFENNEAHSEGFYGLVVAANGNSQPDSPIRDEEQLARIRQIDWTGPDTRHPHTVRGMKIWQSHYALRPHSPSMLLEDITIDHAVYGIYRPAFENHVYRNLRISHVGAEPFNRGMDDAGAQNGVITVDGLIFISGYGNNSTPLIQISEQNLSGSAATHLRNVRVERAESFQDRWPLVNRGVGTRAATITEHGVPIYIHDHFGPERDARIDSVTSPEYRDQRAQYRSDPPLTGDEAAVAEVADVAWPELLDPIDDVPPATIITSVVRRDAQLLVRGVTHDNGKIVSVQVNGQPARIVSGRAGVYDWEILLPPAVGDQLVAAAEDASGNAEQTPHRVSIPPVLARSAGPRYDAQAVN